MNAIETMAVAVALGLSFSHLFWVRPPGGPTISNFTSGLIGHKCGEGGEHLIPLDLVCEKLQRTISSAIRSRSHSFLQRWKALDELHNLAYFDFYHMLRCIEVATVASSSLEVVLAALATFLFGKREFTLVSPDYSALRAAEALREPCQALKILALFKLLSLHTSIATSILFGFQ